MSDIGGAAHSRLHVWADPSWAVTMPDVLEGQCRGIRGWKYELNGSQLVLLSDFCLNRVDLRSVETVQRKLLVLRSRRPVSKRCNSGKNRRRRSESGSTGPPVAGLQVPTGFPRTVTFSCRQRQSLQTSFRFVWKGMIVARLKTPFCLKWFTLTHRCLPAETREPSKVTSTRLAGRSKERFLQNVQGGKTSKCLNPRANGDIFFLLFKGTA